MRGLVEAELDEELFYRIGRAAVVYSGAKHVYVGYDMRPSSVPFKDALIRGITTQGAAVTDIGLISTPMLNIMTILDQSADLGVMVTASHNPQEYNGCKFIDKRTMMPIGLDSGLDQIRDMVEKYEFVDAAEKGEITLHDVRESYLHFIFSHVDTSAIQPLSVVFDMGNGIQGVVIDDFVARLPIRADYLYKEPDGTFPNHEPNPIKYETLRALQQRVVAIGADIGFAYDGDADRIGVVDEQGNIIPGDLILAFLVPTVLAASRYNAVLYDTRSSKVVPEVVTECGGQPIESRVGRAYIIQEVRKNKAALGGELSNHFYYQDLFGFESDDFTVLFILKILSESGKKMSELVAPLRRYYHSGEINFEVTDKEAMIKKLEDNYARAAKRVSHLDGVKVEYEDWWFNARKSNTEPLLRLVLEAHTKELMEAKLEEIRRVIENEKNH